MPGTDLRLHLPLPFGREGVDPGFPPAFRHPPLRLDEAPLLQAAEGRVERSLLHPQGVVGGAADQVVGRDRHEGGEELRSQVCQQQGNVTPVAVTDHAG